MDFCHQHNLVDPESAGKITEIEVVADPVLFEPMRLRVANQGGRGLFYARVIEMTGIAPGDVNTPWNVRWRRDSPDNRTCPLGHEESEILIVAEPWDDGRGFTFLSTPDKKYPARLADDIAVLVVGVWNEAEPSAPPHYCNVRIGYRQTEAGTHEPLLEMQAD